MIETVFLVIQTVAIVVLVLVTWSYAKSTATIVNEQRKDRKIASLREALEKLYSPIVYNEQHLIDAPFDPRHPKYPEYARFFEQIRTHAYLARPGLRPHLDSFLEAEASNNHEACMKTRNQVIDAANKGFEEIVNEISSMI